MDGTSKKHEEDQNAYKVLVRKPEGKTLLRRNTCQWKNINPYPTAFPYGNGMVAYNRNK